MGKQRTYYVCNIPFDKDTSFDSFEQDDVDGDSFLQDALLIYLSNNNIELFERRGRIAATDKGFFGAFYDDELQEEDLDFTLLK
jgi:hypothetical protein